MPDIEHFRNRQIWSGISIGQLIFPKVIVVTSFAILIVSDSIAALVGRSWGHRKFLSKSLEGSTAFFVSAMLVVLVTPKLSSSLGEYGIGAIGALVGMLIEASALPVDDNITVPLGIGAAMWALYALFYPTLGIQSEVLGAYLTKLAFIC